MRLSSKRLGFLFASVLAFSSSTALASNDDGFNGDSLKADVKNEVIFYVVGLPEVEQEKTFYKSDARQPLANVREFVLVACNHTPGVHLHGAHKDGVTALHVPKQRWRPDKGARLI